MKCQAHHFGIIEPSGSGEHLVLYLILQTTSLALGEVEGHTGNHVPSATGVEPLSPPQPSGPRAFCSVLSPLTLLCFLLFQPHWSPCWPSNTPSRRLPQGLCICCLLGLECSVPRYSRHPIPAYLSPPLGDPNPNVLHPLRLLYSLS